MVTIPELSRYSDFMLGEALISPSRRVVRGPGGEMSVEPRVMQVLVVLAEAGGQVLGRDTIFRRCWGDVVVGEDSLNRAMAALRRIVATVAPESIAVETVPRAGYAIRATSRRFQENVGDNELLEAARASWRLGLPQPDYALIGALRGRLRDYPADGRAWGLLSLLLRTAVEYCSPGDCQALVPECEQAARRALALNPDNGDAEAALAGLAPLFGNWLPVRRQLLAARDRDAESVPVAHDIAVLEMATGRPSMATPIIEALIERDPLAAIFHYKRIYHLWTSGRHAEMDRVADRALHLWPRHPAIWFARVWSLGFTGRPAAALALVEDSGIRPPIPPTALEALGATLSACACGTGRGEERSPAVTANLEAAKHGPAQCAAAIIHLAALGAIDRAFDVVNAYYLRRGPLIVQARNTAADPSINDQHRRITQMLFVPATEILRCDRRFPGLCEDIGLGEYWRQAKVAPDFLKDRAATPRPR